MASRGSPLGSCWFKHGFAARHCALLPATLRVVACSQQAADFSLLHCFLELGFQWSLCRLVFHPSCGKKVKLRLSYLILCPLPKDKPYLHKDVCSGVLDHV